MSRPAAADADALLVRGLGTRQLTAAIFNYTVGSGIFALPALMFVALGPAAPLAYVVCALVMLLVVLVFAEAGSRVTATGGPYAYVGAALGPLAGFVAGVLLATTDVAAAGAIAMLLAGSLTRLLGLAGPLTDGVVVTLLVAGLAAVNVRGVSWGARLIEICTAAKLVPLVGFVLVGLFFVRPANLAWSDAPGADRVATAAGTLIFAFTGIEAALQPSGEVRDAARTVPRAAMLALAAATALYLAVQAVALGVLGPAIVNDTVTPLASAAGAFAGRLGRAVLLAGAAVSMFGWLTGAILAGPRALFAFGRDGFLPAPLAAVHPRYRTPHVAVGAFAVIVLALALSGTFERLAIISNLAALGLYLMSAAAVWVLRRRGVRGPGEPFLMPGGPAVPALLVVVVCWIMWQTITRREIAAFGVVLLVALAMYALRRRESAQL